MQNLRGFVDGKARIGQQHLEASAKLGAVGAAGTDLLAAWILMDTMYIM